MNQESKEHLSSLMDGEVSRETGRFLVRRLGVDGDLRQTWARYHLVRDCLRHQDGLLTRQGLSSRVQQAISDEPASSIKSSSFVPNWFKPVAGAALAASVAFVAILAVSQSNSPGLTPLNTEIPETVALQSFSSPKISSMSPQSQPVNLAGKRTPDNAKMNAYLLRHYQATEKAGGNGFVSFVPIVLTEAPSKIDADIKQDVKETESDLR